MLYVYVAILNKLWNIVLGCRCFVEPWPSSIQYDVIIWQHFPRYWPVVGESNTKCPIKSGCCFYPRHVYWTPSPNCRFTYVFVTQMLPFHWFNKIGYSFQWNWTPRESCLYPKELSKEYLPIIKRHQQSRIHQTGNQRTVPFPGSKQRNIHFRVSFNNTVWRQGITWKSFHHWYEICSGLGNEII